MLLLPCIKDIQNTISIGFDGVLTVFTPSKPIRKMIHKIYQSTHSDILKYIVHLS